MTAVISKLRFATKRRSASVQPDYNDELSKEQLEKIRESVKAESVSDKRTHISAPAW